MMSGVPRNMKHSRFQGEEGETKAGVKGGGTVDHFPDVFPLIFRILVDYIFMF